MNMLILMWLFGGLNLHGIQYLSQAVYLLKNSVVQEI